MPGCTQLENSLYIGPSTSTYDIPGLSKFGLFTSKNILMGSVICVKKGIVLHTDFLNYSDYDISNIRYITTLKGGTYLLDKDLANITYADFTRDPLDFNAVNTELVETTDEYIILKATKDIKYGKELFLALGKFYWYSFFRANWNLSINSMPNIQKKVKEVYALDDNLCTSIYESYKISKTISEKLDNFMFWDSGTIHTPNNLVNVKQSCFMDAILQCLSHIPALTRLLLETDFSTNLPRKSFLSYYIELVKVLIKETKSDQNNINIVQKKFTEGRSLINKEFQAGVQNDAQEFLTALTNKFSSEFPNFEYIMDHLFGFYYNTYVGVIGCNHTYCSKIKQHFLQIEFTPQTKQEKSKFVPDSQSENLESLINKFMEKELIDTYKCSECNLSVKNAIKYNDIDKYPRIFTLQLKRFNYSYRSTFIKKSITYDRYMTFTEGVQKDIVYYELIGVVVFEGYSLDRGHYISYVLNSDDKWYKLDDSLENPEEVSAFEACNQKLAYLFFYRRYDDDRHQIIEKQKTDMLIDSYGKDKKNLVAVSLNLTLTSTEKLPSADALRIINLFKTSKMKTTKEFMHFIKNEANINLNFFRYFDSTVQCYNSCVPNGACGYQLDFLLRERTQHNYTKANEKDKYITSALHHITKPKQKTLLCRYFDATLNHKNFFKSVKKPYVNVKYTNDVNRNTFQTYDDWIFVRYQLNQMGKLFPGEYHNELIFYKFMKAYLWMSNPTTNFVEDKYPENTEYRKVIFDLWYGMEMFNYTKENRDFSIFNNSVSIHNVPYIKNFLILNYTSKNDNTPEGEFTEVKIEYSLEEIMYCVKNMNHGVLDSKHFYLLITEYLEEHLYEALLDLLENMLHIIKYGEFKHPEYDRLHRLGVLVMIKRAYLRDSTTHSTNNSKQKSLFGSISTNATKSYKITEIIDMEKEEEEIQKREKIAQSELHKMLQNSDVPTADIQENQTNTIFSVVQTHLPPSPIVIPKTLSRSFDLIKVLLPDLIYILKDSNYRNDKKYSIIKKIKNFHDNNLDIINTDPTFNTLSEITVLTNQDNVDENSVNINSAKTKKSPKKSPRKFIMHVGNNKKLSK